MEAPGHTLPPGPWVNRIRLPQRREHSNSVPPSSRGPSLPPSRHECPTLPEVGHPWTRPSQMPNETLTRLPAESQSGHLRLERRREGHSPPPVPPDVPLADESIPRRPREAGAVASKTRGFTLGTPLRVALAAHEGEFLFCSRNCQTTAASPRQGTCSSGSFPQMRVDMPLPCFVSRDEERIDSSPWIGASV